MEKPFEVIMVGTQMNFFYFSEMISFNFSVVAIELISNEEQICGGHGIDIEC